MKIRQYFILVLLLTLVGFSGSALAEEALEEAAGVYFEDVPDIEYLQFASGEVVEFDAETGAAQVKFYLDEQGNPSEALTTLQLDEYTEITDGEVSLDLTSVTPGKEVDVEFDARSMKVTYIFVY